MTYFKQHIRIRTLLALALVASLTLSLYINWFQAHLHILPDGRIIIHSHLAAKGNTSKGRSHSHSRAELTYLHLLHTAKLFKIKFIIIFFLFFLFALERISDNVLLPLPLNFPHSRRAPPFSSRQTPKL